MVAMRGEYCIGFGSILSLASLLLLIFLHVGQINTSTVPRSIYMVQVDTSGYQQAMIVALANPFNNVYAPNSSVQLASGGGLRHHYLYGLYTHCAYLANTTEGLCSSHVVGNQFRPFDTIVEDLPLNISRLSQSFILQDTPFTDAEYTSSNSRAAYWMVLLGTICAGLTFITGIPKRNWTFAVSTIFAIAGSILLLIAASIWTVLINRTDDINTRILATRTEEVPLGLVVTMGNGLILLWVAFGTMTASVIPYMISCCTWRG
ncbi:hypothetical protein FA15DRAFT_674424 [Coprinopsis marcescibilis]|uniref:Actin cortical patch SUR7/pH-response regulator PalI n=1 Tax=Coprinopsis marcescibilis TaxID=230819 RepID=A0A5C3KGX2_COPMA|nr:hypothetical protein FA15DRAFT_674424 [Coprinopsis marcescibilis]